jgi:autotransporter-associated beta strand protein
MYVRFSALAVCAIAGVAHAAVFTWNPAESGSGPSDGSGTWMTGTGGWWDGTANVAWTSGNQAVFGAGTDGTYSVDVGGAVTTTNGNATTGGLNFENDGYTLSAASAQSVFLGNNASGSVNSFVRVAPGKTATIGPNVTVRRNGGAGGQLGVVGGGTLEVATGGTLLNTYSNLNEVANGTTLRVNGGTATFRSSLVVGQFTAGSGLGGAIVLDDGAVTLETGNMIIGRTAGDVSSVSLNDGSLTVTAGAVRTDNGAGTLTLNGGTLTATQIYRAGGTLNVILNGGTLRAAGTSATDFLAASLSSVTVDGGGVTIDSNGRSITANASLAAGAGNGGLAKIGTGTLTLAGANTYTGPTNVDGGTLLVTGGLGATTVSVAAGGTLGGTGTIAGPTTILAGGTIAPGVSPGTLTISGSPLVIDDAATLAFEINAADTTVGGGINDLINGIADLTLGGTLNLAGSGDFTSVVPGTTWRLMDYTGLLTDNTLTIGTAPTLAAGLAFAVDVTTANQVNLSVVPEPVAMSAVVLGLAVAGRLVRRRVFGRR